MSQAFNRFATCALALAATLAAMPSQADQTLYGTLDLNLSSFRPSTPENKLPRNLPTTKGKTHRVQAVDYSGMSESFIGFAGQEKIGDELTARFVLESNFRGDTGASSSSNFWSRNAYVGLTGGFGTAKLGHQWNVADDYMCSYFVCGYYAPFLMSGFYALSDYYDNTIKYTSANYGGFEGAVSYTLGEKSASKTAGNKLQLAGNYGAGPVGVGVVFFNEKAAANLIGQTNKMFALGGFYDFGVAKARLGYAKANVKYGTLPSGVEVTNQFKATLIDLGVDVPLSAAYAVSADYVMNDKSSSKDDTSFLRLRGSYALSKRTSLNEIVNVVFARWRAEEHHVACFAVHTQLGQLFYAELAALEHVELSFGNRLALRLIGIHQTTVGEEILSSVILKFNCIGASVYRRVDHACSQCHITIVINANFSSDETRLPCAD